MPLAACAAHDERRRRLNRMASLEFTQVSAKTPRSSSVTPAILSPGWIDHRRKEVGAEALERRVSEVRQRGWAVRKWRIDRGSPNIGRRPLFYVTTRVKFCITMCFVAPLPNVAVIVMV